MADDEEFVAGGRRPEQPFDDLPICSAEPDPDDVDAHTAALGDVVDARARHLAEME